jgi:hypothetical protein
MLELLVDKILEIFNSVPELFLARGDPHFDVLRWWFLFVLISVSLLIIGMARRAFRSDRSPPKNESGHSQE